MKKKLVIASLLLILSLSSFAQRSIQAMVFDGKNGLPIEMGAVRLLHASDSTFVQGCQTDLKGNFILTKVKPGTYTLLVTMVGYVDYRLKITMAQRDIILKNIQLKEDAHLLQEVEVRGTAAQMVVKGDTTEFNATAFKTQQNAVVEDLLKRLPGVEVSAEGKITVNGQAITKIRVNGKKFFNDDVEMATKNIPAELIDKVQVLDQKSDMAQLTGFEDNDTERIINLTFKANRKKGTFGNISGGAGADLNGVFRYDGNGILNMIDGESQSTVTAGGNNTNTTRSSRGRGGSGVNSGNTATQNIGYNLNSIVNPQLKIGGDASLNHSFNETVTNSKRQSFLSGSTYLKNDTTVSHSEQYAGYMRLEAEWKPDTLNTFLFQPNISYTRSFSDNKDNYSNQTNDVPTSWGNTSNTGNNSNINGSLGIIYSHKFASKKGRTFTANLQTGLSQSLSESYNYSNTNTPIRLDSTIDQYTSNHSNSFNVSLRMSYVEPLWNLKNFLETSVSFKNNMSSSEKNQYQRSVFGDNRKLDPNDYGKYDSVYSNNYQNRFYSETLELNYRYVDKTYNLMLGVKGEPSQTYSSRIYQNGDIIPISNEVLNFAPTARLQYNFGRKKYMRIDYRGQTEQPSISQLQPVKNNSNPMNVTIGNPDLKPDFNHSLRMMYTSFNDSTFSSFNASLWSQLTKDALVTNSIYDATGKQYSQTVNSSKMPFNVNGNVMFNIPLIQKRLHFNTNTSFGANQYYGYSSRGLNAQTFTLDSLPLGKQSETFRYNAGESISLTYTADLVEIGLRGSFRYSNTRNNLNPAIQITKDWSGGGNLIFHLPYNFNIGSDLNYTTQLGYSATPQNQLIWNGTIDKTIFNNLGVIALKVNDILHQQLNVRQTIGDNYIQYNTYNVLPTYFILSFTYKINNFKGGARKPDDRRPDYEKYGPGSDHQHHDHSDGGGGGFRRD